MEFYDFLEPNKNKIQKLNGILMKTEESVYTVAVFLYRIDNNFEKT